MMSQIISIMHLAAKHVLVARFKDKSHSRISATLMHIIHNDLKWTYKYLLSGVSCKINLIHEFQSSSNYKLRITNANLQDL